MNKIKIAEEFSTRLVNRDRNQGNGKHTGIEFREKYLSILENRDVWKNSKCEVELDFENVEKIGPSFANEVFAHFTKYTKDKNLILKKIKIINISQIKLSIIQEEILSGYSR